MSYREFRNEVYYNPPDQPDLSLMRQSAQHAHELRMQGNHIKASKEQAKKKEADNDLKGIAQGASVHPKLNDELDTEYSDLVDRASREIQYQGTVSHATKSDILKHEQKVKSYKEGVDALYGEMQVNGSKMASANPSFNTQAYYKDVEDIRNSSGSGQEAMQRYGSIASDPVKYHMGDVALQNYMKVRNNDASKLQVNSSIEDPSGKTIVNKTTSKTPFPVLQGEETSMVNGKEIKTQTFRAPEKPEEIPQSYIEEYMSLHGGNQGEYERRSVTEKQKKEEIARLNADIKAKNEKEGANIAPVSVESYGEVLTQKLAERNARKKLFDMQQVDNLIDSQVKRDSGSSSKPRAGSLETYRAVPVGTNNTRVKMRSRGGDVDKRTYLTSGKDVALIGEKGDRLKIDASNFDGINEETGKRFTTTQSVDGNLSSVGVSFGVRYTDKNGRTTTNPQDIGEDMGKSYTEGLLKHFTDKKIEEELRRHPDAKFEFFPEATASIKPRKNDYSELSSEQVSDVEEYKKLKEKDFHSRVEIDRMADLAAKYEAYVDQNISTNANNIGQVVQYARTKGHRSVMDLALSQHSPEEKEKLRQTQMEITRRVESVKAKMAQGKPVSTKKEVQLAQPKAKVIKSSDIPSKAAAAGYSTKEYTALLKQNGITIE